MKLSGLTSQASSISTAMNQSSRLIRRALERLSSGQRVNSPRDDIASFSLGTQLDSKIRGLRTSVLGLNQGRSLLDTASAALSVQTEILQRMRELAVQAANETLNDRGGIQSELQSLLSEFQRITSETEFNGQNLLSGDPLTLMGGETDLNLPNQNISELFTRSVGAGSFQQTASFDSASGVTVSDQVAADFNGDGLEDLAFSDSNGVLRLALNRGNGTFENSSTLYDSTGYFLDLEAADINGDGVKDLLGHSGSSVFTFINNGDGSFATPITLTVSAGGTASLQIVDVNEDGVLDFISGTNYIEVYLGDGSGGFERSHSVDIGSTTYSIQYEDVSGDGRKDLVYIDYEASSVRYLAGQGSGLFASSSTNLVTSPGSDYFGAIRFGDLDGDGDRDLVVSEKSAFDAYPSGYTRVYLNSGSGSFSITASLFTNSSSTTLDFELGDLDNDGILDIVTAGSAGGVHYFLGRGNGTFSSATTITSDQSLVVTLSDFDQDGVLDISLINNTDTRSEIYFQNTKNQSALSQFALSSAEDARELLGVLDTALENQISSQAELSVLAGRLERRVSWLQEQESVSVESRSLLLDADIGLETSELVRAQILQQAQIAALSQNQVQASLVLNLLQFNR